ncbi:hypothetical protein P355_0897 [Burkholderia cenocepacia KC-01]|nr:hypothetical protein P355_0897 [Burkholderia cenocepacia KC-01]
MPFFVKSSIVGRDGDEPAQANVRIGPCALAEDFAPHIL